MKMISNDLRSSCRSLLLGAYQEGGGGTYRNAVFHDIVDDSDVAVTIPIYGDYKITVNVWETDRPDVYGVNKYVYYCSSQQSADEGDCQNLYYLQDRAMHLVFVAWNGDTPLYAQLSGTYIRLRQYYQVAEVRESNDTRYPLEWYACQVLNERFLKGSTTLASEIDHFEFGFGTWAENVRYFNDHIYPCDSSGNHISVAASFKTKRTTYSMEREDVTQIPTINPNTPTESSYTLNTGSDIQIFINSTSGTYSDFDTADRLIAAHGEIVRAICLANGMDYRMAHLLLPETEE